VAALAVAAAHRVQCTHGGDFCEIEKGHAIEFQIPNTETFGTGLDCDNARDTRLNTAFIPPNLPYSRHYEASKPY